MHVHGTVYDETESGIPAVLVSNGEEVVFTNSKGKYEIVAEPGVHTFIFVSVPDTYRPAHTFYHPIPSSAKIPVNFTLVTDLERANEEFFSHKSLIRMSVLSRITVHKGRGWGRKPARD